MPDPNAAPAAADDADDGLGAALEANWDAQEASDDSPAATGTAPSSAPASASSASSPAETGVDAGRTRDAAGKFTKADPKAVAAQAQVAAPAGFNIPEKWPADVRARIAEIHRVNPEHAKFVLDQYAHFRGEATRHVQFHEKRIEKLAGVQKQIEDLLAPGRQARALRGHDDVTHIRNLVAADDFLNKSPVEGIKYIAKTYGIDLNNLNQPGGGVPEIPPAVQQVMQENAQIKAFLMQQHQGAQDGQLRAAGDWINQFASQRDPQGNPKYPYFDEVLPELIVNVQYQRDNGQQIDVHAAYDRAIRMNDQVWLKEQTRKNESSRKEDASKRAREIEDAKRAGYSVSGSGADTRESVPDDIGDNLLRNYDKLSRS